MDNVDRAMGKLSILELELIVTGAKRGTLTAVNGDPMSFGLKAAIELARRKELK